MSEEKPIGHFIAGIVLIALGVLFLVDRAYVIRFAQFFEVWWPSLLILWGVVNLVGSRCRRWTGALVLITLGAIFQGETLHISVYGAEGEPPREVTVDLTDAIRRMRALMSASPGN